MSARDQANSDPLPYVQVDRSAFEKAALLAPKIGVSSQHTLGGLVKWWQMCADPRRLERIVAETPEGEEPKLVLTGEELVASFDLAVAPERPASALHLEVVGLVQRLDDDRFRVRGMSRAFTPILNRIEKREAGSKGGKASAAKRAKAVGNPVENAQPGPSAGSQPAQAGAQPSAQAGAQPSAQAGAQPSAQAGAEANGNTAVSDQRSATVEILDPTSEAHRDGGAPEVQNAHGVADRIRLDDERREKTVQAFMAFAREQAPQLADPGPQAWDWARRFFDKYDPYDGDERLRQALVAWLTHCSLNGKTPGWGLWLSTKVNSGGVWEDYWLAQVSKPTRRSA